MTENWEYVNYTNKNAFAALKDDNKVVTWGDSGNGGDTKLLQGKLSTAEDALFDTISQKTIGAEDGTYTVSPINDIGNGKDAVLSITINAEDVIKVIVLDTGYGYTENDILKAYDKISHEIRNIEKS